jgi:hypothetical protein
MDFDNSTDTITPDLSTILTLNAHVSILNLLKLSISNNLTATGTNQATALSLGANINITTTVAAGTGVLLPNAGSLLGTRMIIFNQGANTLNIYPGVGYSIDGGATNAPITLASGKLIEIMITTATTWYQTIPVPSTGGGGGTGAVTGFGTATLNFGAFPGSNEASVTVTGLTAISATSTTNAYFGADATTSDYTANDHKYLSSLIGLSCSNATAGSGFTIYARSLQKIEGSVSVNYYWSN